MSVWHSFVKSLNTKYREKINSSITKDIVRIAYKRISGVDGDIDGERVRGNLRELLDRDYALSVYGSTA